MDVRGERVHLRPARADDAEALAGVLAEPEVARWWGRFDLDRVRAELPGTYAIVVDGAVQGWLLAEEETEPDYRHVAFDIAIATALHGRGYGPEALRLAIRHFIDRGHHRFTIDPAVANERAVRAYAAVGFKPVGVMRAYERGPDGAWHDNLLMDLLASEFDG
jgi:aminoglycoside 6'-N-acetyltransferase